LPFDDSLFAIEEQQFDRNGIVSRLQHPRQLDEERRAGSAVVGADERKLAKELRVVMSCEHEPRPARPPGDRRTQLHHLDAAERRRRVKRLLLDGNADLAELLGDIRAGLLDGRRSRGPRAYIHELTHVLVRASAVEDRRAGAR
jgi:hypothetical protein